MSNEFLHSPTIREPEERTKTTGSDNIAHQFVLWKSARKTARFLKLFVTQYFSNSTQLTRHLKFRVNNSHSRIQTEQYRRQSKRYF